MKRICSFLLVTVAVGSLHAAGDSAGRLPAADVHRHAEVARRGADVMPFDLAATTHVFTRTPRGGVQRVVAKDPADERQVALVREHLRDIHARFGRGDFSGPAHIHGHEMPGLAELRSAPPGRIDLAYQEVRAGAELTYRTADDRLVAALHRWFDAQLADHGPDAMGGHHHHPSQVAPAGK